MITVDASETRPSVKLPQGTVVGIRENGSYPNTIEAFKGVPFALPPTGDRRFRPPVKVAQSLDVIDASKFGPRAPARQFLIFGPTLEESEDCLTANIFRPVRDDLSQLLPVVLYFHGGAFNRGNAAMHDTASMLGWSSKPFIGISFGYRIGALGFLPSRLSAKEGALNLGLKDQICMMEWVHENIHLFGGDKDNVTLSGLSAGAHSIGHHLLDYEDGKAPLFHRVIMESGAPTSRAVRNPDAPIHEEQFQDYLRELRCPPDLPEWEIFPYLRSLPISMIAEAQATVFYKYNPSLRWAFQPVIDGDIIRHRPIDGWREGKWHKVPIMAGFQGNEGSLYVNKKMATSDEFIDFWSTLLPQLSERDLQTIDSLYPDPSKMPDSIYKEDRLSLGVGPMYRRIEAAYGHYAYVSPVRQTAQFAAAHVPVYIYHWGLRSDVIGGARHGDNMLYEVRDSTTRAKSKAQDEISEVFHAHVTNFICTGSPDGTSGQSGSRASWAKYDPQNPKLMIYGKDNTELIGGKETGAPSELIDDVWSRKESDFWWSKVEISQQ